MAKPLEKQKALELRRAGKSVKEIAACLNVSRGSVSHWVRDIALTEQQKKLLKKRQIASGHLGRQKGAQVNQARKQNRISSAKKESAKHFKALSKEMLFHVGLGLYWGEGSKSMSNGSLTITNSDSYVICLMVRWFKECFEVGNERFCPRIYISDTHRDRERILIAYWSQATGIPEQQFGKTVFLNKGKKLYENRDIYYGVLALRIARGTDIRYRILAHIERIGQLAAQAGVVQELERGTHKP